jgi:hypothetical protein
MAQAGFPDDFSAKTLEPFVRFGTPTRASKSRGDQFDRIELERDKDVAAHRTRLAGASWLIKDLPIGVAKRNDFEEKGLFVCCALPLHLDVERDDRWSCSGSADLIYPNWINPRDLWFLGKDNRLYRSNPLTVGEVRRNGGVLYYAEAKTTSLVLNLRLDLPTAKKIARETHSYFVDLVVERLEYAQAGQWSYFRTDALREEDGDCASLVRSYNVGLGNGVAPFYFVVDERPWMVQADLRSAVLKDHTGKIVASYQLK